MNQSLAGINQELAVIGMNTIRHKDSSVELLFDSFCQPSSAGMRSGTRRLRQMLYRADPYQIDLQLEADREHNRLIVAGQLLDVTHPEMPCLNVQVAISNLHGSVVKATTNQFGEFSGEVESSGDLELTFLGHTGKRIVILLRGAAEQSSGA